MLSIFLENGLATVKKQKRERQRSVRKMQLKVSPAQTKSKDPERVATQEDRVTQACTDVVQQLPKSTATKASDQGYIAEAVTSARKESESASFWHESESDPMYPPFQGVPAYSQQVQYAHHAYYAENVLAHNLSPSSPVFEGYLSRLDVSRSEDSPLNMVHNELWAQGSCMAPCPSFDVPSTETSLVDAAETSYDSRTSTVMPRLGPSKTALPQARSANTRQAASSPHSQFNSRLPMACTHRQALGTEILADVRGPVTPSMRLRYSKSHLARKYSKSSVQNCFSAENLPASSQGLTRAKDGTINPIASTALDSLSNHPFDVSDCIFGKRSEYGDGLIRSIPDNHWETALRNQLAQWRARKGKGLSTTGLTTHTCSAGCADVTAVDSNLLDKQKNSCGFGVTRSESGISPIIPHPKCSDNTALLQAIR